MARKRSEKINRRSFLKGIGAAGLAPAFAGLTNLDSAIGAGMAGPNEPNLGEPNAPAKPQQPEFQQVPKRPLGKTAVSVSALGLGTNRLDSPLILHAAFRHGVTLWDTSPNYVGGSSELAIGKFLQKNPENRRDIFIATKASGAKTIDEVEQRLRNSLEKMNTDYVDLYHAVHGLSEPGQLTDELRSWAATAKKKGLVRFVGFSTHKNIPRCLYAAAECGWIDAVITSYNFRLMADAELLKAIDICHKKGVGIIAMKTVAMDLQERKKLEAGENILKEQDKSVIGRLLKKGLTVEQAGIKAVLEDERIASACVGMGSVAEIDTNAAAVLDKDKLGSDDRDLLSRYARATASRYCAGCAHICDSILPDTPCVSDIMRCLMYYNSYGDKQKARELFAQFRPDVRSRLLTVDYTPAEQACPQHLPIGKLVAEAVSKLA